MVTAHCCVPKLRLALVKRPFTHAITFQVSATPTVVLRARVLGELERSLCSLVKHPVVNPGEEVLGKKKMRGIIPS